MKKFARAMKYGVGAAVASLVVAQSAFAGGSPYDVITDAVDFTDVGPLVYGVAGALAAIYVIIKGVKIGLSFVKGG